MHKILRKFFLAVIISTVVSVCSTSAAAIIKGDANGDGELNNKDVVSLFRSLSSASFLSSQLEMDFNEDHQVDNKDVVALFRYVSTIIKDCEHEYYIEYLQEPTCNEEGEYVFVCFKCGHMITEYYQKTEHNWSDWSILKDATPLDDGVKERICLLCGEKEFKTIKRKICAYHAPFTGNSTFIRFEEATCKRSGSYIYKCNVCETEYWCYYSPDGKYDPHWATAHHYVYTVQQATATEDALEIGVCSECGDKTVRTLFGTATAKCTSHDVKAGTSKYLRYIGPTCTENGYHLYHCSKCGYDFKSEYDQNGDYNYEYALGHTCGDWYITQEPTDTENGEMTKKCIRCGKTTTTPIDKENNPIWGYSVVRVDEPAYEWAGKRKETYYGIYFDGIDWTLPDGEPYPYFSVIDYRMWGYEPEIFRSRDDEPTVIWTGIDGEEIIVNMYGFDKEKYDDCCLKIFDDGTYEWMYYKWGFSG